MLGTWAAPNFMKQQAIIVQDSRERTGFNRLNNLLNDGWIVVQTCPMPSSSGSDWPTCLVILQKND